MPAPVVGRRGPVGHLVPPQPGLGEALVGEVVLVGQVVLVGHRQLAPLDLPGQRGAVLDDEGVGRDVVRLARERGLHRGLPVGQRLPRRAVDQVEADVLEAGLPRPVDGRGHPHRVVGAVQRAEHVVDRRLHPEADPVEARGPQLLEVPRRHAVGVGLRRDLHVVGQAELGRGAGHDGAEVGRLQQRRRTASEEDRLDLHVAVAEHVAGEADLADRCLGVRRPAGAHLVAELLGGVGVEVAVAAAHAAERDVDVEAERLRAELRPGLVGEQTVLGRGVAVRLSGGHARNPTTQDGCQRYPLHPSEVLARPP